MTSDLLSFRSFMSYRIGVEKLGKRGLERVFPDYDINDRNDERS